MLNNYILFIELLVFLVLMCLVLTDKRFSTNRKCFFVLLSLFFWAISLFIDKAPFLIIKDLFWYSLVLNCSFIFHVLVLNRMFEYCWKKHYEYLGFLISRISYFCSIWGIMYIITRILEKSAFLSYKAWECEEDTPLKNKFVNFMIEFGNERKFFEKIYFNIYCRLKQFLIFILCIFIHFSLLFHNYSLLLMGKNLKNYSLKTILVTIIIFLLLLSISIKIGISRLYIWWIILLIIEMYKIFTFQYLQFIRSEYVTKTWVEKLKMSYEYHLQFFLTSYYENKYIELSKIYKKIYHPFFMFNLYKFLYQTYYINEYKEENFIYPIKYVYQYYPWEKLALGYLKVEKMQIDSPENEYKIDWTDEEIYLEAEKWIKLINIKEENQFLEKVFIIFDPEFADYSSEGNILYIEEVKKLIESKKKNKCQ